MQAADSSLIKPHNMDGCEFSEVLMETEDFITPPPHFGDLEPHVDKQVPGVITCSGFRLLR